MLALQGGLMTTQFSARPDPELFSSLIGRLRESLTRKGLLFATAESCTGGIIAGLCTDVAGSSVWFAGGVVAYSNDIKHRLLGVPEEMLLAHGAVSEAVVRRMALGALAACNAQAAVAISGIAGPDGGTPEKPVGTVWIAHALTEKNSHSPAAVENAELAVTVQAACHRFPGGRAEVRLAAVREALRGMVLLLERG